MKFSRIALLCVLVSVGCGKADSDSARSATAIPPVVEIEGGEQFEEILKAVDSAIGKRFQSMQMGAMNSATYQFDGSIDKVVEVIEPLVIKIGYSPIAQDATKQAIQEGQEHMQAMANMKMGMVGSKMYQHENGNVISVIRMDISADTPQMKTNMKMLIVQMMNPKAMAEIGVTKQGTKDEQ